MFCRQRNSNLGRPKTQRAYTFWSWSVLKRLSLDDLKLAKIISTYFQNQSSMIEQDENAKQAHADDHADCLDEGKCLPANDEKKTDRWIEIKHIGRHAVFCITEMGLDMKNDLEPVVNRSLQKSVTKIIAFYDSYMIPDCKVCREYVNGVCQNKPCTFDRPQKIIY